MKNIPIVLLSLFFSSCISEYSIPTERKTFSINSKFDWNIDLPSNWEEVSAEQTNAQQTHGKEIIEDATEYKNLKIEHKTIFNLRKGKLNALIANVGEYSIEYYGPFDQLQKNRMSVIEDSYTSLGIGTEITSEEVTIDEWKFMAHTITMYKTLDKIEFHAYQKIWDGLVDDQQLYIAAMSNSEKDFDALVKMVENSSFTNKP